MTLQPYRDSRRAALLVTVILSASLLLSGCWDNRDINTLSIIGVLGVDGGPGEVRVTAEIFRPAPSGTAHGSGGSLEQRIVAIATGDGESLLEAIRCMNRSVPRQAYGSHIVAIIVGEEYARNGIEEILDLWHRVAEYRSTAFLLVAKGRADDILTNAGGEIETTVAAEIEGLRRTARTDGRVLVASVHQVTEQLTSDARAAVTGVVELLPCTQTPAARSPLPGEEERPLQPAVFNCLSLTGLAIFKDVRLQNMIPASDLTKSIVSSADTIQGSVHNVKVGHAGDGNNTELYDTTIEVTGANARVRAETQDSLKIVINIELDIALSSQLHDREITAAEINEIQKSVEDLVRSIRTESVKLLQSISCDVMGFAGAVHRADPALWASIKDDWDEIFKTLEVDVVTKARLRHTGMSRAPIWKVPKS